MPSWKQPGTLLEGMDWLWEYILRDIWGYIKAAISFNASDRKHYWDWLKWDLNKLWAYVEEWAVECVKALDSAVTDQFGDHFKRIEDVREYLWELWDWMGPAIKHWGYTATSWAEEKRDEAWQWAKDRFDDAKVKGVSAYNWVRDFGPTTWAWIKEKAPTVWTWIKEKSSPVWTWISEKGGTVWTWIQGAGQTLKSWWDRRHVILDAWIDKYQEYYQDLFDKHRNNLLDLLEDPVGYVVNQLVLSTVEQWIYGRWFAPME